MKPRAKNRSGPTHPAWVRVLPLALLAWGCAPSSETGADQASQAQLGSPPVGPFVLTSSAFVENGLIPVQYTGDGENSSPPLEWSNAPPGTQSFALTMVDPDVPWGEEVPVYGLMPPPGTQPGDLFIHWIAIDIPAELTALAEGASPGAMPAGVRELSTSFALFGGPANQYGGPAPPPQLKAHRYVFTLFALDVPRLEGVTPESDYAAVTSALAGHVLGRAQLTGFFGH